MAGPAPALLRERGSRAGPDAAGAVQPSPAPEPAEGGGRLLACAACRRGVTTTADRISVDGGHEHTFINPHGFCFRIGCFARAAGCVAVGPASAEWTWFAGRTWQVAHCRGCRGHLGWLFRSAGDLFHGLIVDRLVEIDGPDA